MRLGLLLGGAALRGCRQAGLVAAGGVLLDQTLFGGLVYCRESCRERVLVGIAPGDRGASLLQRAPELRRAGTVTRLTFFGLPSLLLGRANIRHEMLLLKLMGVTKNAAFYLVSIPSALSRCRASCASCDRGCSCTTYCSCTTP